MRRKKWWKKNEEKIKRNDVICCELMCSYLTWCESLWLVLSWCVWTKSDVKRYDRFYPYVFRPNFMWSVVIGSILMCLGQTWCDLLCLGSILMCLDLTWCDLLCCEKSKRLKVQKKDSKIQVRDWHVRRKSRISKV